MIKVNGGTPVQILLVEDNPGDARLTEEALREAKVRNILHHVENGIDALAFLRHEGDLSPSSSSWGEE